MAFEIFGYRITKNNKEKEQRFIPTPVTPSNNDGSTIVSVGNSGMMSGYYQYGLDIDGTVRSDAQMITQYRATASYPDVDTAIEAIVNEAVIVDQTTPPVSINLDNLPDEYSGIRDSIQDSFNHILNVLEFNDNCHDIFKRWYIDGKLYYFVIIDPKDPKKGIVDLKYIDPRKIRKVIEYVKQNKDGVDVITDQRQYYVFNDNGLTNAQGGIKISTDSIINVRSGLIDANSGEVVSYLFKAIKPTNQLKMMEDSLVIYRITRAPERRVFYVDVGNLPGQKAEQYVRNIMNKFRNKVVYDAATGEVKNNRNYMNMCLAMDTKVSLLDGRELTIRQIADELNQGKTLWTYSCDPVSGKVVPGKIDWAGVTQKSAKVLKITLDNGESITCTPDHKFPIKNIGFVRADELKINDSLVPLYRRQRQIDPAYKNTYEQYYDNEDHQWYFTHRKVVEYTQDVENFDNKRVIHHADLNRYNNNPENLVQMDWQEHRALHNQLGFRYKEKMVAEGREEEWNQWKRDIGLAVWNNKTEDEKDEWTRKAAEKRFEYYDRLKEQGKWDEFCSKFAQFGVKAQQTRKQQMQDPQWREQFKENCRIAQNDPQLRAKKLQYAKDHLVTVIDKYIADFAFDFLSKNQRGSMVAITKLAKALNNDPVMLQHLREINKGRNKATDQKTFGNQPLKKALVNYFGCENWNQFVAMLPKCDSKARIDDDIAKFIVDLCKQPVRFADSAKRIAPILNQTDWVMERMDQINQYVGHHYWRHRFTADNVSLMVCRHYGFKDWFEFRDNLQYLNHRIVSIEWLDDPIEVGCLTIDKHHAIHDYHTFALSVGVFTHNCEDFWLPRREGGKATEIVTLPGSQNLSQIEDVEYFQRKLYQSMNVPRQRLQTDNLMSIGNNNEITREEVAFSKFIQRLRNRFNVLFKEALRIQLIATKTIRQNDWEIIRNNIFFEYQHDNYFEELKRIELFNQRMTQLQTADSFKGVYFSKQYIVNNVLDLSEQQWAEMQQQIKQETIQEAIDQAEVEQKTADFQAARDNSTSSEDEFGDGGTGEQDDSGYDDFVNGNEGEDEVDQSGDTTNTIDDTAEPNPGEDEFDRPAATGLTVAR